MFEKQKNITFVAGLLLVSVMTFGKLKAPESAPVASTDSGSSVVSTTAGAVSSSAAPSSTGGGASASGGSSSVAAQAVARVSTSNLDEKAVEMQADIASKSLSELKQMLKHLFELHEDTNKVLGDIFNGKGQFSQLSELERAETLSIEAHGYSKFFANIEAVRRRIETLEAGAPAASSAPAA